MLKFELERRLTSVSADHHLDLSVVQEILNPKEPDKNSFFNEEHLKFPTGLWPFLKRKLDRDGHEYTVVGDEFAVSDVPDIPRDMLDGVELVDHQVAAVRRALAYKRGVLGIATNGGKTEIQAAVAKLVDQPSLLMVGQVGALEQTEERWQLRGFDSSLVRGRKAPKHALCTIQSMYEGLKRGDGFWVDLLRSREVIQFDECHQLGSAFSWQAIAMASDAPYRLGYSGTAFRSRDPQHNPTFEDMTLMGAIGDLLMVVPPQYLVSIGFSAQLEIWMVPIDKPNINGFFHKNHRKLYKQVYQRAVVDNVHRNNVIAHMAHMLFEAGERVLTLVLRIEHGKNIGELMSAKGMKTVFSSGGKTSRHFENGEFEELQEDYKDVKARFVDSTYDQLIGSSVYYQSQDIPGDFLNTMIVAPAGRSMIQTIQRIGRAARRGPTKTVTRVIDFDDRTHPFLKAQSKARAREYEKDGYKVNWGFPPGMAKVVA